MSAARTYAPLSEAADLALRKEVVTPEGIPLTFRLARAGDRAAAFLIDLVIAAGAMLACSLLLSLAAPVLGGSITTILLMLALFGLRQLYFIAFEVRWNGATPGKRFVGIRVVDRRGGMLTAEAIFARNLVREVEVFVPGIAIFLPEALWPDVPGFVRVIASVWLFAIVLMPLLNKERLRAGDLIAGTMVVLAPRPVLLEDLGAAAVMTTPDGAAGARYAFTPAQLDIYGIYELQVLEDLLRQESPDPRALRTVAAKIVKKIRYAEPGKLDSERFLRDFYAAQRARLESRMLMGERRERKRARGA